VKILLDMNLSPAWVAFLAQEGFESVHWSHVGDPRTTDAELMAWARTHGYVVLTHDMDFGTLLAATRARGPSVLQARVQDTMPDVFECFGFDKEIWNVARWSRSTRRSLGFAYFPSSWNVSPANSRPEADRKKK
jgi:predicted nuclease of predicted toxin-antitoxin system